MAKKPVRDPAAENARDRATIVKGEVEQLKHQIHRFQAGIRKLEEQAGKLRQEGDSAGAAEIEVTVKQLRDDLGALEAKLAGLPDVADALGITPAIDFTPTDPRKLVEPAKFEPKDVKRPEHVEFGVVPLSAEWPRTGQIIQKGKLVSVDTVGKLRGQVNDTGGEAAGNVPFRIVADDAASGERIVLRHGSTDAHGYFSVNLSNTFVDRIDNVAVEVGIGDDNETRQSFPVRKSSLATHRDLGIAHQLNVNPELVAKIKPKIPGDLAPRQPGTIEDPDAADIANSPQSFGLNEEHVDDNCCLRPSAEIAARQYHFRQIVRLSEPELVIRDKALPRIDVRAPIPFGDDSLGNNYAVTGGSILLGTVNLYRQSWYPAGRGLGELLYSLALAPCEHVNLAFIDWSRTERDTRTDTRVEREQLEHDLAHDRSISEVVDAVLTEHQSGRSTSGGGGASLDLGIFSIGGGGGTTSSSTSGRRQLHASTVQSVSDEVSQRSSAARSQRATVVTTSAQRESERIQTRTVHNHNRNHAMSVQYFQVLSHYKVKTELVEEKPVLLIPYEIDDDLFDDIPSFDKFVLAPSRPITRFLDRHSGLIRRMVSRRYRRAFESLSRLLHCRDVYDIEQPFATFSRWNIRLDKAWRPGISLSIETKSGQSINLTPRGGREGQAPVEFVSDPVKTNDIDSIRVAFDAVEAARSAGSSGLFGFLGDAITELLEKTVNHKLSRIEISARTDRSRFVPEPQSFRLVVTQPDVTLSADNPFHLAAITPPSVSFEGYRGREHRDYCQLKELIAYIHSNPMRFMRAIWYHEDPDRRALRLDRFDFQGRSVLDSIVNRPVGVLGNYVAFELMEGHRLVQLDEPNYVVSSRLVSLPTRGVFAEVFLSCCNATEKRDVERFIDPDQACQVRAPEITGVTPGTRASRSDTTPTAFPGPLVALQNAPGLPDPGGLTAALNVLGTPNIFRDLSRGAELLQFINNATKEAFTSTRQHRAAMDAIAGDVIRGIVSAYTGVPISGSTPPGAASSGTTGITSSPGGASGAGPGTTAPGSSSGAAADPALQALSSELVRQSSPAQVNDHVQTIRRAVDSGLLSEGQGNQLTNALLGGTGGLPDVTGTVIILTEPNNRDGLTFGARAGDKSGSLTLRASVKDAPENASIRWTRPNPAAMDLTDQAQESVTVTPLIPGRQEIDFTVKDASGTQVASIKVPLSVPQFVAVRENAAVLDPVLAALHVDDIKEPMLQTAKEVCDLLLNTANVRTIWEMAPFNETLPAQFAAGGAASARVTVATLEGNPPTSTLAGETSAGTGGIGPAVFDETISIWPGAFDDAVSSGAAAAVDDATRQIVQTMQGQDFTDLAIKQLAIQVVGRLIGESLAHEIIHSLLGFLIPTGHNSPAVPSDIMNRGNDRSFQDRTGFEIVDLANFPADGSFVDHGIGFINIPTGATQTLLDQHFPVSI